MQILLQRQIQIRRKPVILLKAFMESEHPRNCNGKFTKKGNTVVKDGKVKKEQWNSSSEKAKTLKIEDFGKPDEVREMAKPIRYAENRYEATRVLKDIANQGPLVNKNGLTVTLSSDSRGKIVSSKALHASYGQKAHFLAVANLDKLYRNSIEPWTFELNPNKSNDDLTARRYLYAPLEFDKKIIPVKITVKEYKDVSLGKRLYSIEAIDVELKPKNKDAGILAPSKP